jgi:hypothetical protein
MLDPETSDHSPPVTSRQLREFSGIWLVFFAASQSRSGLEIQNWP